MIVRYRETGEPGEPAVVLPLLMADQPMGIFIAAMMGLREVVLTALERVVRSGGYETVAALHVVVAGDLLGDDPRCESLLRENVRYPHGRVSSRELFAAPTPRPQGRGLVIGADTHFASKARRSLAGPLYD